MVVRAHHFLRDLASGKKEAIKAGLRKRVGLCLGVSECIVDRILAERKSNNGDFPSTPSSAARGRPPLSYSEDIISSVRKIVLDMRLNLQA